MPPNQEKRVALADSPLAKAMIDRFKMGRKELGEIEQAILGLKTIANLHEPVEGEDRGEVIANIMLAYRHIQDAKMRLGKGIEAIEGYNNNN